MSDVVHYSTVPFRAICGADAIGQATTNSSTLVTCPECFRAAQEAVEKFGKALENDFIPYTKAWVNYAATQFAEIQKVIGKAIESFLSSDAWRELQTQFKAIGILPDIDAYEAYARDYNWRHPCKKISARRLSRRQRQEAIERWTT